jgi:hypothetical protein
MELSKREKERIGWENYSRWKRGCTYGYVQGLWSYFLVNKIDTSFEEFVRSQNHWKSLDTAKSQIETWEREKKRIAESK